MEAKANVKFKFSSNDKNQLEKFYHDLNEKLLTVTNTVEDSVWE